MAVLGTRYSVHHSTISRIVKSRGTTSAVMKQAVARAVDEARRKLTSMKISKAHPQRRVKAPELRKYLVGHTQGLRIELSWIPCEATVRAMLAKQPTAARTRQQHKFQLANQESNSEQRFSIDRQSRRF